MLAQAPLPCADERGLTIYEQEEKFRYVPEGTAQDKRASAIAAVEGDEEKDGALAVAMIKEAASRRNQTLIEHIAMLRSQAVKLSKANRCVPWIGCEACERGAPV